MPGQREEVSRTLAAVKREADALLFCECGTTTWVVFANVSSQYHSDFFFFEGVLPSLRVSDDKGHRCDDVNFNVVSSCFVNHVLFAFLRLTYLTLACFAMFTTLCPQQSLLRECAWLC